MSEALTKDYLDTSIQKAVTDVGRHFSEVLRTGQQHTDERFDKIDERFDKVNQRFDKIDARLDTITDDVGLMKRAVLDLAADAHLHNLVRELRTKGIELDEARFSWPSRV